MLADHQGRVSRWTLALLSILSMKGPDGGAYRVKTRDKSRTFPFPCREKSPSFSLAAPKENPHEKVL
jgi:hypothetical protein